MRKVRWKAPTVTGAKRWIECISEPDATGIRFFTCLFYLHMIKFGKLIRKKAIVLEWNDIYNVDRQLTGNRHRRGTPWRDGEYGLVVCVWVYDGAGNILLTRRAPGKSFAGTWENSGGAAKAGETSLQAIVRELYEETGICALAEEFELLSTTRDKNMFYDHYCLKKSVPVEEIVLLPGETDGVRWAGFAEIHEMIRQKQICSIIAEQFLLEEQELRRRQTAQE